MPTEVKIPALGESIAGGVVSKWHKQEGESVKSGDVLLTLETDKVAQDIAAESDGVLRQRVKEGEEVAVGAVVGAIEEKKMEEGKTQDPRPEKTEEKVVEKKAEAAADAKPEDMKS